MNVMEIDYAGKPDLIGISIVKEEGDTVLLKDSKTFDSETEMINYISRHLPIFLRMDKLTFSNFNPETAKWFIDNQDLLNG